MTAKIFLGLFGIACGAYLLSAILKKHNKIDTESIAVVNSVQYLGRDEGRKVYAIRYNVQASEPFELLVTPCKKALKPGTTKSIFYEKADPSHNYYFKTIGQFDRRFLMPSLVLLMGVIVIISFVMELF